MEAIILYDLTGKIWHIIYGASEIPQGIPCVKVDIPEGAQIERIDLTDPENPHPVFRHLPETDYGKMKTQLRDLENELSNVQAQLTAHSKKNQVLEEELLNTQLALTELYEGMEV